MTLWHPEVIPEYEGIYEAKPEGLPLSLDVRQMRSGVAGRMRIGLPMAS